MTACANSLVALWAFKSFPLKREILNRFFAVEQYQKSRSQLSWQHASDLLRFSRATFVWMSPSMTRVGDLIACYCCCRYTLSDDSMGEQVRSQPIVTNRSEISRSTSNCVETLTLLFTKLHLEPYQSQTEVCLQRTRLRRDYHSQKKKRGENKLYCSCQHFILSEFLLYKCLTICKHTHTKTHAHIRRHWTVHVYAHALQFFSPVKDVGKPVRLSQRKAHLFIYLSSE